MPIVYKGTKNDIQRVTLVALISLFIWSEEDQHIEIGQLRATTFSLIVGNFNANVSIIVWSSSYTFVGYMIASLIVQSKKKRPIYFDGVRPNYGCINIFMGASPFLTNIV